MTVKSSETFIFDKDNLEWVDNFEFNEVIIREHVGYLRNWFKVMGYIYLNDIYELFNIKWYPRKVNTCFVYGEDGDEIQLIHMDKNVNGILFTIAFVSK